MGEMWQQVLVGVVTACIFVLMMLEAPPDIVFFMALTFIMLSGILSVEEALEGFSNSSLVTIGALFLVVGAVQKSHIMDYLARKAFGITSSNRVGSVRMLCSMGILSAFFNNIPLCNLMIPIVRDWARARSIPLSYLLMPLSYIAIAGGLGTMIGTSTSLIVQGLLQADEDFSFPFFAPGAVALPASVLLISYMIFGAPVLLTAQSGLIREMRDKASRFIAEVQVLEGSAFISDDVGTFVGKLGLQQDSVVKIRRRLLSGIDDLSSEPEVSSAASQQIDSYQLRSRKAQRVPTDTKSIELSSSSILSRDLEADVTSVRSSDDIKDAEYFGRNPEAWGKKVDSSSFQSSADDIEVNGYRGKFSEEARLRTYSHDNGVNMNNPEEGRATFISPNITSGSGFRDIINPSNFEIIRAGDVIFITSAAEVVTKVLKTVDSERTGLTLMNSSVMDLPGYGSELIEVVLSDQNPFIGRNLRDCLGQFSRKYGVAVISCRARSRLPSHFALSPSVGSSSGQHADNAEESFIGGHREYHDIEANDGPGSRDSILSAGDTVLCLAKSSDIETLVNDNMSFFSTSTVGSLPRPMSLYGLIPAFIFSAMILVVASEQIAMCPASLAATSLLFMGGWLKGKDISEMINLRLLLLMGCSISFAKSVESSGLATTLANGAIEAINPSRFGALFLMYFLTLCVTETMSNNAAAALMYPISRAVATGLNCSPIPFAYVVLIAATAAFMSPIGYQTHIMVWGPGGYKFLDFMRFGFIPDLIFCVLTCTMAPWLFPF